MGDDNLCHPECGSGYCRGNSVCVNGECKGCNAGYVLGTDYQCHLECGSGYCTGNSVCINGECKGCNPGYYLGTDYRCHPEVIASTPAPVSTTDSGFVAASIEGSGVYLPGEVLKVTGVATGSSTSVTVYIYQFQDSSPYFVTSEEVPIYTDQTFETNFSTYGYSPGEYGIVVMTSTGEFTKLSFTIVG
jgi:hypothetical protein